MREIAFIGLGSMGLPMAKQLVAKGFSVRGFDVRAEAVEALRAAGGGVAASAKAAARGADALLLMVVSSAQAEQVLFAEDALSALAGNATVILTATCAPRAVEEMAAKVLASGRSFVDAPVSGGIAGASGAALTIMAAAPQETFAAVRPILAAMGDKLHHVGERPGQGAMVKTINQLLCGVHIAAAAEAFALAAKSGLDPDLVYRIVANSAASSWMLRDRGPRMFAADPAVTSAVDIFVKDLGIVADAGRALKAALPLASTALQFFLATSARGAGAADDSQIIRTYNLLNGAPNSGKPAR